MVVVVVPAAFLFLVKPKLQEKPHPEDRLARQRKVKTSRSLASQFHRKVDSNTGGTELGRITIKKKPGDYANQKLKETLQPKSKRNAIRDLFHRKAQANQQLKAKRTRTPSTRHKLEKIERKARQMDDYSRHQAAVNASLARERGDTTHEGTYHNSASAGDEVELPSSYNDLSEEDAEELNEY